MKEIEFNNIIEKYSQKINIELQENQKKMLYQYMNILSEWNKRINLTAIVEENEIILKHFIDSLTIEKYIKQDDEVIDIGTGAGFPGIPLKILNNSIKLTLLDSVNKKINFLEQVKKELKLQNVECIHSRAEQYIIENNKKETYDIGVSRAVASLNTLVEYILPYIKINGICICMKGPNIQEELKEAEKAINVLGGKIEKIEEITLPYSDIKRNIIIIRKEKNTPKEYPRKAGKPKENPIK